MSMVLSKETNIYKDTAVTNALNQTVSNLFYDQTTFARLTHDGTIQGIFLENGQLYINMTYLRTGALQVMKNGVEMMYVNSDNGTVRIRGEAISIASGDAIDTAISNSAKASYGTCSTAAGTVAKVVTSSTFSLYTGATINVKFTYANTVASPTLNVNGTGAKAIYVKNSAITSANYWVANSVVTFTYDGSHWLMCTEGQTEIFNILTGGQANQGIYLSGGNLYINASMINTGTLSASYIYGGMLTLGGSDNGNGTLVVKDSSNSNVVTLNNNGLTVSKGSISGGLITSGKIQSASGEVYFDLTNNKLACNEMVGYSSHLLINRFSSNGVYYTYSDYYRYSAATGINIIPPVNSTEWGGISCSNGLRLTSSAASSYLTETVPMVRIGTTSVSDTVKIQANSNSYIAIKANPGSAAAVLIESSNSVRVDAPLYVYGSLTVTGTKPRLVTTQDYSQRYLYCYETPSPLFGDVGEGIIMEDGKCYIWIDSIFAETVSLNQYQVFLQKYGDGDCWVEEKTSAYFVVSGTAGLQFGWEIKAKQSDFDQYRLERFDEQINSNNEIDYANELLEHIADIQHEREVEA